MSTPEPGQPEYGSYPPPATGAYPPLPGYLPPPGIGQESGYLPPGHPTNGYPRQPVGYPVPGYGAFPVGYPVAPRNGLGTAALVLGIIGVVLCWNAIGIILGILAIIFGGVGMGRAKQGVATNRGSALAGLVLGIVALALFVVVVIAIVGSAGFSVYG